MPPNDIPDMRFSSLVERIAPDAGSDPMHPAVDPWDVHFRALDRIEAGEAITLLSIGQEADHCTPREIVAEAIHSLEQGDHHYADVSGIQPLREAISAYHHRLTGQVLAADQVTVFAGAQNALFSCAQVLLETGDDVILVAPYYTTYPAAFASSGAQLTIVETSAANDHHLELEKLASAITADTRVIVLNVPGNPVAVCPDADTIRGIVDLCKHHGIWLVMDAVYLDIVASTDVALPHLLPGAEDILITIGSLSKSHRMTGWRIGWAAGPRAVARHFQNLSMCMHYGLPPFVQQAARHALSESTDTPRVVREALAARRQLALEGLGSVAPARLLDSGRGMFILLDVAPLGVSAHEFALTLLERHAVSVLPCTGFGPGGETLVRIGLCVDGGQLQQACIKVRQCVDEHAHREIRS